jgi:hypothetical protein
MEDEMSRTSSMHGEDNCIQNSGCKHKEGSHLRGLGINGKNNNKINPKETV